MHTTASRARSLVGCLFLAASVSACGGAEPLIDEAFEPGEPGDAVATPETDTRAAALTGLPAAVGYGRATTGGAGGTVCHVTGLGDAGPGTLRDCATRSGATWVVFDLSGDISLRSMIGVASDKTIDGRGRKVRIRGYGLRIAGVRNVILENLLFDDGAGSNEDAIQIIDGAQNVVVDHCTLSDFTDGLLDITRGATDVTVSWNRFTDHDKVMLIGASPGDTGDTVIRVTLHHNAFIDTTQRHPRLRYGRVHALNNYFKNWKSYGIGASQEGQVLSEANIYEAGKNRTAVQAQVGDDPKPGRVRSSGDWKLGGASVQERDASKVWNPRDSYPYTAEKADAALRTRVSTGSGWQTTPFPL